MPDAVIPLLKKATVVLLLALMAGCTDIRDIPPEVQSVSPPMRGTVRDGVYHAEGDHFRVALPKRYDDPAYQLVLKEESKGHVALVTFVPLQDIAERYYVFYEDYAAEGHAQPKLSALADATVDFFGKRIADTRLEPLVFVKEESWEAAHTAGLIRLYTEKVPSSFGAVNLRLSEDYTAYHLLYVTVSAGKLLALWLEWPKDCSFCHPSPSDPTQFDSTDPVVAAMARNLRVRGFIDSLDFVDPRPPVPGR